jgi:hypothetical protein
MTVYYSSLEGMLIRKGDFSFLVVFHVIKANKDSKEVASSYF